MKIVLIYPSFVETFWSFKYALKFISKKSTDPPLGLLTVAAMLPQEWEKKLIDMNVTKLRDKDLIGADYVFLSAMSIQKESVIQIIALCKEKGIKIVAGGPLFTTGYEQFEDVDHFILNEAEITLPPFLADLEKGCAKHLYSTEEFADIAKTPLPLWELIDMKKYALMDLQYSRGCPYSCDFCDVTNLFGRKFRTKSKEQVLKELNHIYAQGWRGGVFFVDDNFVGNKKGLKEEILPAIIQWMKKNRYPFNFNTQVSIDLADDDELQQLMVDAGFSSVFIGIETPNQESLVECNKHQNKNRDLIACIKKIQTSSMQVVGGFIVGFDNDPDSIFDILIKFIQNSTITIAMVGLLNAPRGTKLYQRLSSENRILKDISGDNTDSSMNFVPKMKYKTLITGYKKVINGIYSPAPYYERIDSFLKEFKPIQQYRFHTAHLRQYVNYSRAFVMSIWYLGIIDSSRKHYWKLFFQSFFRYPRLVPIAFTYAIYGYHFRKVFKDYL